MTAAGNPATLPLGADGNASGSPACKCGAPLNATTGRCTRGHVLRGNTEALVTGETSAAFWREHDAQCEAVRSSILRGLGFNPPDAAPAHVRVVAESIAQVRLVRDSAFFRLAEQGGPTTSGGRLRRTLQAWTNATEKLERLLRTLGADMRAPATTADSAWVRALTDDQLRQIQTWIAAAKGGTHSSVHGASATPQPTSNVIEGYVLPEPEDERARPDGD